jgi:hypothetical protein
MTVSPLGQLVDEKRHSVRTMNANTDPSTGMPVDATLHVAMLAWHSEAAKEANKEVRKLERL